MRTYKFKVHFLNGVVMEENCSSELQAGIKACAKMIDKGQDYRIDYIMNVDRNTKHMLTFNLTEIK